jgi:putative nucleotidyltransferase with HDIG domain
VSPAPPNQPERFFAVSLDEIEPDALLPCDVWIRHEGGRVVLYRARDLSFEPEHVERLTSMGVRQLLIAFEDAQKWSDYVGQRLCALAEDTSQPLVERLRVVIDASAQTMRQVFEDPGAPHVYGSVDHVSRAIRQLMGQPAALGHAVRLMSHDYYTYTHCLQVSMYAVALAQVCGEKDPDRLAALGRGCLMHDIGKCVLPREVLNKPGPLTGQEWELIRSHPKRGVSLLQKNGWNDPEVFELVACHHERLDGTGYPFGLSAREISFPVRVASVCDAFDAMTTDRAYERAKRGVDALQIIRTRGRDAYDQRVVDHFIRSLLQPAEAAAGHPSTG